MNSDCPLGVVAGRSGVEGGCAEVVALFDVVAVMGTNRADRKSRAAGD
jgi:hypothetical protein